MRKSESNLKWWDMPFKRVPLGGLLGDKGYIRGPFGSALKRPELKKQGIPVYEQQHAINGVRDFRFFIDENKFKELKRFCVQPNDLIISCSGTLGRVSMIKVHDPIGIISQALLILRPDTKKITSQYLLYFLSSKEGFDELVAASHGSVQVNIAPRAIVEKIKIPLPEIDEQIKITGILNALDKKIELNQRMNDTLEGITQALFKSWFVDFDPVKAKTKGREPEGMDEATAALFPSGFDDKNVPQGWRTHYVSEAIELNPYEKLPKGMMSPYFEMAILPTKGCIPAPPIIREFSSGTKFRNGDTLLARITPCLENGKTAYINCLSNDQVAWGSTEFIVMRSKSPLPPEYTYLLARDENFRAHAIQSMTGTSGRQRVQIDALGKYKICIPTEEVAQKFGQYISPMFRRIALLSEESNILSQIRDTLLPRLISGELRVGEISETVEALAS